MKKFESVAATLNNPNWSNMISRSAPLYTSSLDLRDDFERDYDRIINSTAYRRLKHKTQVFFSPGNDHICTRIEHIMHVDSISHTISNNLGLNTDLTRAIAVGHDLGHSPFGHSGERILSAISERDIGIKFWHEKNGLDFVDSVELLEDSDGFKQNLNLTYAVRDGIISHCGEVDENSLKPRNEFIDLVEYTYPNQYAPYTWEACVVKISDKISYVCRDIEDAITIGILNSNIDELISLLSKIPEFSGIHNGRINNTNVIKFLINDLCDNSSVEKGLSFSNGALEILNSIKEFNYKNIYNSSRVKPSIRYFELVINEIYDLLKSTYTSTSEALLNNIDLLAKTYPNLGLSFKSFICNYYDLNNRELLKNKVLFNLENEKDFYKCIIFYISGMTDNYAMEAYQEIIGF